jgi:hypothetical protein
MARTPPKDPYRPVEARLAALEQAIADLAAQVAALKRQRSTGRWTSMPVAPPPAIRSRGPKAQMTDEAWLAQRRNLAAHARAVAAKKAAKKGRKR